MRRSVWLASVIAALVAGSAHAELLISEIFYNLAGSEGVTSEWVEIYNSGNQAVDASGYMFADTQDGDVSGAFAAGTSIAAGGTLIVTQQSPATFASIWGNGINLVQVTTFPSLSNSASPTNETLALLDASSAVLDEVNYENATNGWPDDTTFSSIYLLSSALTTTANDIGSNWANSADGVDGAYTALIVNPDIANATVLDVASPGIVMVPEPATLLALAAGALLLNRRRRD